MRKAFYHPGGASLGSLPVRRTRKKATLYYAKEVKKKKKSKEGLFPREEDAIISFLEGIEKSVIQRSLC